MRENENCRNFVWIRTNKPWLYEGYCLLGECKCDEEPCMFYEEEKDESKRTDKNPADNT